MSKTTTLAPSRQAAPIAVPIRPSDRLAAGVPRHAVSVIPIVSRREVIVIETATDERAPDAIERLREELESLAYSSELL